MINRRRAICVALATISLAGCSTFESNDAAADVDGTEISRDQFEETLRVLAANSENTGLTADLATGSVAGEQGRGLLGQMIVNAANRGFLAAHDESITDEDRNAFIETVQGNPLLELPEDVLNELVEPQVGPTARARITAPDAAELEQRYNESPAATGAMCVRHIVVGSEEAAEDLLDELEAGADFAELADENDMGDGGAVTSQNGDACLPLLQASSVVNPTVVSATLTARPGVPPGPVETADGWEVIEIRPYDEVADALNALYEEQAGELMFFGYLATTDIEVDPRYGRWDPVTFTVLELQ